MKRNVCIIVLLLAASPCRAGIITVDDDGPANFSNIQAAINYANHGDVVIVEPGTYTGPGNYNIRFNGKAITVRGAAPEHLDIVAATVIDCNHQGPGFIFDRGEDPNSVLSGLTITNGRGSPFAGLAHGGAITCDGGSPIIANCIMTGNSGAGGAISATGYSDLIVRNCIITHNTSGTYGGGIFCTHVNSATIENCIISHNRAERWGGGIRTTSSYPWTYPVIIKNCIIVGNRSDRVGGGISSRMRDVVITGCIITGNSAAEHGGGILGRQYARLIISNSIVSGNSAPLGPEIALLETRDGGVTYNPALVPSYSNIRGGLAAIYVEEGYAVEWGPGNIDVDPCFAEPGYWGHIADANTHVEPNDPNAAWVDGDYHLKSQAGRWDPTAQSWILDDATSLCIDAADPMLPFGAEPFPNGGRINMGAYGGTIQASKSYSDKPPCRAIVAGDINGDCKVDATDFAFIAGHWLIAAPLPPGRATRPHPPDGATRVRLNPALNWTPGANAVSHDVYFGTQSPGTIRRNQTETTFNAPAGSRETTYYWRIDEINAGGTTTGPVWSFTTESAIRPDPPDGSRGISTDPVLSWQPSAETLSYDVYFGTANPPQFQGNQEGTTFAPGPLSLDTTYYWRIDEVIRGGVTTGPIWTFTTKGGGTR